MPFYKAPDNSLHFIDPQYAYILPPGCVEITDEEAEAIRIASMPEPVSEPVVDPVEKLRAFLATNPDVAAIL